MRLQEKYKKEVALKLKEAFGYKSIMAIPAIEKVAVNIGAGKILQDSQYLEVMENPLKRITGQKPIKTRAKKSIASFKIRAGMVVGFQVTLRGARMWDFIEKLINVTFPRVHDFRGLNPNSFDKNGNYSIGFREYTAFPEIRSDEVEKLHGLEVSIATTAKTDDEGRALLTLLGFPFKKN